MSKSVIQKYRKLIKSLEEQNLKKSHYEIDLDTYVTSRKNLKKSIDILFMRAYTSGQDVKSIFDVDEYNRIRDKQSKNISQALADIRNTKNNIRQINKKLSNLL